MRGPYIIIFEMRCYLSLRHEYAPEVYKITISNIEHYRQPSLDFSLRLLLFARTLVVDVEENPASKLCVFSILKITTNIY